MSSSTNISTRYVAEEAVLSGVIIPISSVKFNAEHFRKFNHSMVNIARPIPTEIGGGGHGHIYLLEDHVTYMARTGGVDYVEAVRPGALDFTGITTNAGIARIKEARTAALEAHNTQERARTGLRKKIICHILVALPVAIEDTDSGLEEVDPRILMAALKDRAAPVTVLDAQTLKAVKDKKLTFDDEIPLAIQFALVKKAVVDLLGIHLIATSKTELVMGWYAEIEKEKDFEKQVAEFRERVTNNGFEDFITFFSDRDVGVRRLNKLLPSHAEAMGYHSAAYVQALNERINEKVEGEVANLAELIKAVLNAGALNYSALDQTVAPEAAANVTDTSKDTALLNALKDIQERLSKVEGGGGRRRGHGCDHEKKDDTSKPGDEERKPCKHYDKHHIQPDNKCWKLEANTDARPRG